MPSHQNKREWQEIANIIRIFCWCCSSLILHWRNGIYYEALKQFYAEIILFVFIIYLTQWILYTSYHFLSVLKEILTTKSPPLLLWQLKRLRITSLQDQCPSFLLHIIAHKWILNITAFWFSNYTLKYNYQSR